LVEGVGAVLRKMLGHIGLAVSLTLADKPVTGFGKDVREPSAQVTLKRTGEPAGDLASSRRY
jgi:hypothetical protein